MIRETLKDRVVDVLYGYSGSEIPHIGEMTEDKTLEGTGIDVEDLVDVTTELEETFKVSIPDGSLTIDMTVGAVVDLVGGLDPTDPDEDGDLED